MRPLVGKDKPSSSSDRSSPRRGCKRLRQWLVTSLGRGLGPEAAWIQRHAVGCPRCQRRIAAAGKVELALSLVKSQPHRLDLLKRANAHAIGTLKHSLREASQARALEASRPEPSFWERSGKYRHQLANLAACIAIVLLTRTGLFSSLDRVNTRGEKFMRQYYSNQVGEDLAGEVFDA